VATSVGCSVWVSLRSASSSGQGGVETGQGLAQAVQQQHLAIVGALGLGFPRGDGGAGEYSVAKLGQPGQGGFLDD
jgi:hypothetical protein